VRGAGVNVVAGGGGPRRRRPAAAAAARGAAAARPYTQRTASGHIMPHLPGFLIAVNLLVTTTGSSSSGSNITLVHIDSAVGSDDSAGAADGSPERPFRSLRGWAAAAAKRAHGGGSAARFRPSGIKFSPGIHDLVGSGGLVLGTGGSEGAPFVVSGAGQGQTVLSGGVKVQGITERAAGPTGAREWHATLPPNTTYFRQLFVRPGPHANFSRRLTARSEVMAYDHSVGSNPKYAVVYKVGQVKPQYHNQQDVLATLYHCWTATTHHINHINASNRTLTLLKSPHVDIPRCEHASGKRYLIEDAREELDASGEFYYDRQSRELTYLPLLHEVLSTVEIWAPQLITPVFVKASHVTLQDLSIVHAAADMDGFFVGDCDGQSASNLHSGAIDLNCSLSPCTGVTVQNVEVAHTGGFGVITHEAVSNTKLSRLHLHDLGAGGVSVEKPSSEGEHVSNLRLIDSHIHSGGHVYRMGPGVMLQSCRSCTASHNEIHDLLYTGITTGIGFKDGLIKDTVLAFNKIYTLGQQQLSDMGCVYVWGGNQSGLLVDNNLCFNVSSYSYGGWGLYNDQTTTSVTHTNNVIHSTMDACYHDHEGYNVSLSNNIFVKARDTLSLWRAHDVGSREASHADGALRSAAPSRTATRNWHAAFVMRKNIIASEEDAPLFSGGSNSQWCLSTFDNNCYWQLGHKKETNVLLFPYNKTLEQWQTVGARGGDCSGKLGGQDKHSVVADPMFNGAAQHDYTLSPSSPALKLGFKQIDLSTVGPRNAA
jgi:hypothetical protein